MKKIVKLAFVAAFVAAAGYGVYASHEDAAMSEIAAANVAALADNDEPGETDDGDDSKPVIEIAFCREAKKQCNGVGIEDIEGDRQY